MAQEQKQIDEETYFALRDGVAQHLFYSGEGIGGGGLDVDDFAPTAAELLTFFQGRLDVPEAGVAGLVSAVARELEGFALEAGLSAGDWFGEEQSNALAGRVYEAVTRSLGYADGF